MRILFVADRLFPQSLTGLSTFQWNLLKALLNIKGVNVDVLFHAHREDSFKKAWIELLWLREEFKDIMERVKVFVSFRKRNICSYTDRMRFMFGSRKYFRRDYDYIVLAHGDPIHAFTISSSQEMGGNLIIHVLAPFNFRLNKYLLGILNKVYSNTMIIAFTSEYVKSMYRVDGVIIPPPIDTNIFKPLNTVSKEDSILYIGPLTPARFPYELILKAISILRSQYGITIHLTIVTAPWRNEERELRNIMLYAEKLGIKRRIKVISKVLTYGERMKLYNSHKLLIELFREPMDFMPIYPPYVVIEALSCGTPVLVTNNVGLPEHENIIKVLRRFNPYILATYMHELLMVSENVSSRARKYILSNYSIEAITKKYSELLRLP